MMAGLGKFLLGVAGFIGAVLLLSWLGFVLDTWLWGRTATPPQDHDFWDD